MTRQEISSNRNNRQFDVLLIVDIPSKSIDTYAKAIICCDEHLFNESILVGPAIMMYSKYAIILFPGRSKRPSEKQ
jgi:hypothetical protein